MKDFYDICRRVGICLVVFGLIDIGIMVYYLKNGLGYASSFNLFAVVGGLLVMQGNVRAIRWVTFYAAFQSAGFIGGLIVFPVIFLLSEINIPFEYEPIWTVGSIAFGTTAVILTVWTYTQLRRQPVLDVLMKEGGIGIAPDIAFAVGILVIIALAVGVLVEGDSAFR